MAERDLTPEVRQVGYSELGATSGGLAEFCSSGLERVIQQIQKASEEALASKWYTR